MTPFNVNESSVVTKGGSGEVKDSPPIPTGKTISIRTFRGCAPNIGDNIDAIMVLQWGVIGNFIEIAVGCHQFDYDLSIDLTGNGTKFLRLLRFVPSLSSDRRVFAQVRGVF